MNVTFYPFSGTAISTTASKVVSIAKLDFIKQEDNSPFDSTGNNACHMVSKYKPYANLPNPPATFEGPPGPDPDTFRVQVTGLPLGKNPTIRLDMIRGSTTNVYNTYSMVTPTNGGVYYRTDRHIRLVSNAVDYNFGNPTFQTPLVRLGDIVKATLVMGGTDIGSVELPVGRPPNEDGPKAIRTVDLNFITLTGVNSSANAVIERLSENWAQAGVRYSLTSTTTNTPVANVITFEGTATTNGNISVDVTPSGGTTRSVSINANTGDSAEQIARAMAAAIAQPPVTAEVSRFNSQWIVIVNKKQNVAFINRVTINGITFNQNPPLNFAGNLSDFAATVLALNFKDNDEKTIDMIAAPNVLIGDAGFIAMACGDYCRDTGFSWGMQNVAVMGETTIDSNFSDDRVFVPGHETCHILFDVGNPGHSNDESNLFYNDLSWDTIDGRKRLTDTQSQNARTVSGPSTTPALLQIK